MPRPKGSRNKAKVNGVISANCTSLPTPDFASQIAEKKAEQESLTTEIASIEENLASLKSELKSGKAALKSVEKDIARLEEQKAAFDAAKDEAEKKAKLEGRITELIGEGFSVEEILEKLK